LHLYLSFFGQHAPKTPEVQGFLAVGYQGRPNRVGMTNLPNIILWQPGADQKTAINDIGA